MDPLTVKFLEDRLAKFAQEVATERLGNESASDKDSIIAVLERKVASLGELVQRISRSQRPPDLYDGPLREVFIIEDDDDGKYKELIPLNGTLVDYVGGRIVTDAGDPAAYIELAEDQAICLSIQDANGEQVRAVVIRGSGGCPPGDATFSAVTSVAYASPTFTKTVTTYTVDWCAGTITPDAGATTTVFTTAGCEASSVPSLGERVFPDDRTIAADQFFAAPEFVEMEAGVTLTIQAGGTLEIL